MKTKVILGATGALVFLLIVLLVLITSALNSGALGDALLAEASKATGVSLKAEEFEIGLFSGLEMAGVTAEGEYSAGRYRLEFKRLVFEHQLVPLFSGTLAVERLLLDEPRILLVTRKENGPGGAPEKPTASQEVSEPSDGTNLRLEIAEIRLADGHILVQTESDGNAPQDSLAIDHLYVNLQNIKFDPEPEVPVKRLSGNGTISAGQVLLGSLPVRDVQATLSVQGGVFDFTDVSFSMDEGDLKATLRVDFGRSPFAYEFKAEGAPINVNEMVGLDETGTLGAGRLEISGSGRGPEPQDLSANGLLQLQTGQIPSHKALLLAQRALGTDRLVGADYRATDTQFELSEGKVNLEDFSLETDLAGLDISGWVDLTGPLEMEISVRTPREGLSVPRVPSTVLDILADDKGWVIVPLKVTGSFEDPAVAPDVEALTGQASKGATRILKGFLGGRSNRPR